MDKHFTFHLHSANYLNATTLQLVIIKFRLTKCAKQKYTKQKRDQI